MDVTGTRTTTTITGGAVPGLRRPDVHRLVGSERAGGDWTLGSERADSALPVLFVKPSNLVELLRDEDGRSSLAIPRRRVDYFAGLLACANSFQLEREYRCWVVTAERLVLKIERPLVYRVPFNQGSAGPAGTVGYMQCSRVSTSVDGVLLFSAVGETVQGRVGRTVPGIIGRICLVEVAEHGLVLTDGHATTESRNWTVADERKLRDWAIRFTGDTVVDDALETIREFGDMRPVNRVYLATEAPAVSDYDDTAEVIAGFTSTFLHGNVITSSPEWDVVDFDALDWGEEGDEPEWYDAVAECVGQQIVLCTNWWSNSGWTYATWAYHMQRSSEFRRRFFEELFLRREDGADLWVGFHHKGCGR